MPKAPVKPTGKGLNGKIGPVPVKVALFAAVVLVGYLYLRHRKGAQSTSAGSSAAPSPSSTLPFVPSDTTGGGASGGGAAPETPPTPTVAPAASFPPLFNFSFSQPGQALPDSGGNVSTPVVATVSSSSQPTTTYTNTGLGLGAGVNDVAGFFFSPPSPPAVLSGASAGAQIGQTLATGAGKTIEPAKAATAAQVNAGQAALNTRAKTLTKKPLL